MKAIRFTLLTLCAALVFAGCEKSNIREFKKLTREAATLNKEYEKLDIKIRKKKFNEKLAEFKMMDAEKQERALERARKEVDWAQEKLEKALDRLATLSGEEGRLERYDESLNKLRKLRREFFELLVEEFKKMSESEQEKALAMMRLSLEAAKGQLKWKKKK